MSDTPQITESIEKAAATLLAGDLVAIPTETVYGLAADATNISAVQKVFDLKGRPSDHPLIVHCADFEQALLCTFSRYEAIENLASAFWPGPLTVVVKKTRLIPSIVTAAQDSVALRVPRHALTLELLQTVGRPVVAPSANRFGRVSPTNAKHVCDEFPNSSLLVLDGGDCAVGIESTIVDCRDPQAFRILRPGIISKEQIERVIGMPVQDSDSLSSTPIRVSGNLPSHYSPEAKVVLVETGMMTDWLQNSDTQIKPVFIISQSKTPSSLHPGISWHSVSPDPEAFARRMYALFRKADRQGFQQIAVELPRNEGVGIALRDRLSRAAQ